MPAQKWHQYMSSTYQSDPLFLRADPLDHTTSLRGIWRKNDTSDSGLF